MKIRINCTNEYYELCIHNKKINKKNFIKIINYDKFDDYDYIDKVFLLQKNNRFQSLEFECNRYITEEEFKNFIEDLKKLGFLLTIIEETQFQIYIEDLENIEDLIKLGYKKQIIKPLIIQFVDIVDNKGHVLFNYDYYLNKPEPYENHPKNKNRSFYKQQNLYIKK